MTDPVLVDALRSRGLRMTAQRQLVLEAVRKLGHATPEQLHAAVAEVAAGVNITTIYRTLDLLEELRLVTHTHLTHGAPTYHAVGENRHIHLVCRRCETVTELDTELAEGLAAELLDQRGFVMDIEHLALFGTCATCARPEPGARGGLTDGYSNP